MAVVLDGTDPEGEGAPREAITPIEWEIANNTFQIGGTARALARARGTPGDGFEREDYDLALALWFRALTDGSDLPPDPTPRAMRADERAFVDRWRDV